MGAFLTGLASSDLGSSIMKRIKGRKKTVKPTPQSSSAGSTDTAGAYIPDFKRGGKVRGKKGRKVVATLEPGERVLTKRQARKYRGGRRGKRR